jgi:galactokinase
MPTIPELHASIDSAIGDHVLGDLYDHTFQTVAMQKIRYSGLAQRYLSLFPDSAAAGFFSAPGRTEVGGNHTDHNSGRVLAAAVDLDVVAVAAPTADGVIRVDSEGYPQVTVDASHLEIVEAEKNTSASLIRGVCARLKQLGFVIGGFNACLTSAVPKGSGLSSSAAYEVMIVTILNHLYNKGRVDPVTAAQIGQYAENNYFGKPCGLMDQTTSAVGGFVTIDFKYVSKPLVHKVAYDFGQSGYALVIVETGGDHADLTDEYAGIANEMKSVARALGGQVLREFSKQQVLDALPKLHGKVADRAVLRALHFFNDDARVAQQVQALESGDFNRFLQLVVESGRSSWMLNQNCYTTKKPLEQGVALAQALSENLLGAQGAWRVHGGGFAGTIQVFVPLDSVAGFVEKMEAVFGKGACYPISIRSAGAIKVEF